MIALVDKNVAMSKEQAKKQLIEHNLRLVVYLAKKFENTGVCVEDLISVSYTHLDVYKRQTLMRSRPV